jgi:uncharacterized protein (TIGR01777 family)
LCGQDDGAHDEIRHGASFIGRGPFDERLLFLANPRFQPRRPTRPGGRGSPAFLFASCCHVDGVRHFVLRRKLPGKQGILSHFLPLVIGKASLKKVQLQTFIRTLDLPVSAGEAFAWHERLGAFERLLPPWEQVKLLSHVGGIQNGARVEIKAVIWPLSVRWIAEHCDYEAGRQFRDVAKRGPFAHWDHTHLFEPTGSESSRLEDHVEYALRGGALGRLAGGRFVARKLDRMFAYRHRVTGADLAAHAKFKDQPRMDVCITGASGLVGSTLTPFLTTGGHTVSKFVRGSVKPGEIHWDPAKGEIDAAAIEGKSAVVHLAGESIASGRWTAAKKARIRDSRVVGTRLLCETLAKLKNPPRVLVSASAIGYYGDRGDEELTEESQPGTGFLPEVCQAWENATRPAAEAGVRVVNTRIGVILTPRDAALKKMLLPFKLCLGGVIGSGRQYWSWISLDDVVSGIHHALMSESLRGPVNLVAPRPVTNREFTKTLGKVLGRPTIFPMPAFAARLALGEMADDLLLASARVLPKQLEASGFEFRHRDLETALRHLLGK